MLLSRSLPPQFLLPTWTARQLAPKRADSTWLGDHKPWKHRQPESPSSPKQEISNDEAEDPLAIEYHPPIRRHEISGTQEQGQRSQEQGQPSGFLTKLVGAIGQDFMRRELESAGPELRHHDTRKGKRIRNIDPIPFRKKGVSVTYYSYGAPKKDTAQNQSKTEDETSLFEEMFPEETQRRTTVQDQSELRFSGVGTVSRGAGFPSLEDVRLAASSLPKELHRIPHSEEEKKKRQPGDGTSEVLILSAASRTLEESDFLRMNPRGSHIEGWARNIMKVIPGRDPATFTRNHNYILIFPSAEAAVLYQDIILASHHTMRARTPKSIESPVPPPSKYYDRRLNLDPEEVMKAYTLLPAGQAGVVLHRPHKLSASLAKLLRLGGYEPVVEAENNPLAGGKAGLVMFSVIPAVEGSRSMEGIRAFIESDGRRRNLAWKLIPDAPGHQTIQRIYTPRSTPDEKGEAEGKEGGLKVEDWDAGFFLPGGSKWMISFKDGVEARRFVRAWHMRRWNPLRKNGKPLEGWKDDHKAPIVHAEFMW